MSESPQLHALEWRDGAFRPTEGIPAADRGFRYGMAVFETIAIRSGTPLFLESHLRRLRAACERTSLPVREAALEAVSCALSLPGFTGVARIYVTAGPGSFDGPAVAAGAYLLLEERSSGREKPSGYRLHDEPFPIGPLFPGLKTANYWANLKALSLARAEGCDEALLLNPRNEIVSAALANIFVAHGSRLWTPALKTGARDGVIREWVLSRREVDETILHPADLQRADEVFLTSSGLGIMPATHIGPRSLPSHTFAHELRREYDSTVAGAPGAQA